MENGKQNGLGGGCRREMEPIIQKENKHKDTVSYKIFIDISKVPCREEEMSQK